MASSEFPRLVSDLGAPGTVGEPLKSGGGGGTSDGMEARVAKLEENYVEVRVSLARIEEKFNALATKDDMIALTSALGSVRGEVGDVRGDVRGKLGLWQFLLVMAAIVGIFLRWPEFFRAIGTAVSGH